MINWIANTFIFILFGGIIGGAFWVGYQDYNHLNASPIFHAGQCFKYTNAESWDNTYRIEMVGKHAYLIREIPASLYKAQQGSRLYFDEQYLIEPISCPKG